MTGPQLTALVVLAGLSAAGTALFYPAVRREAGHKGRCVHSLIATATASTLVAIFAALLAGACHHALIQ